MKKEIVELAIKKTITNISDKIWKKIKEEYARTQVIYPAMYLVSVPFPNLSPLHAKSILEHDHYIIPRGMVKAVDLSDFFCGNHEKTEVAQKMKLSAAASKNLLAFIFISEAYGVEVKNDKDVEKQIKEGAFVSPSQRDDRMEILMMQVQAEKICLSYSVNIVSDFTNMKETPDGLVPEKSLGKDKIDNVKDPGAGTFSNIYNCSKDYEELIKHYISCP